MARITSLATLMAAVAVGYISSIPATGNVGGRNNHGSSNGRDNKAGYNGNDNRGSGNGNNNIDGINGNGNGGDDLVDWKQYLAGLDINSQKHAGVIEERPIIGSYKSDGSVAVATSYPQEKTTAYRATPEPVNYNYKLYTPRSYYKPRGYQYSNRNYYNSDNNRSWSKYFPNFYY